MHPLLPENHSLEKKIIEAIVVTFVAGNLIYCIYDVVLDTYSWLSLGSLVMVIGGSVIWYLIHFRQQYVLLVKPTVISLLIIHTAIFFQLNGFRSALALDFINIGFAIVFVFRGHTRVAFLVVFALIISTLLAIQAFIPKLPDAYDDNVVLDTLIHVLLSLYIAYIIKTEYDHYQATILEQNTALIEKNNEILTQNEEIAAMNEALSNTVHQRTRQLYDKNQQVKDYLFLNSHGVRGPLARILGLLEVLNDEVPEEKTQLVDYLAKVKQSATELDGIIQTINQTLSNTASETDFHPEPPVE
jgi:signal transduction histidine kinase